MPQVSRTLIHRSLAAIALAALAGLAIRDRDERSWSLLRNTLMLGGLTAAGAVPIGTMLAVLIQRTDVWGRRLAWSALIALLFVPIYLQAAGWDSLLGRQVWLGRTIHPELLRFGAATWIHIAAAIPWVAIIVSAGLEQTAPQLEEAALLDLPALSVARQVTLPMSRAVLLAAGWWVFAMTVSEMAVTDLYQIRTFAEEVYVTIPLLESGAIGATGDATLPRGTWLLAGFMCLTLTVVVRFVRHEFPVARVSRTRMQLGRGLWFWSLAVAAIVLLIVLVPAGNLIVDAGVDVQPNEAGRLTSTWSPTKFLAIVLHSPWTFRREAAWTLLIGTGAATLATGLAIPLAWLARRSAAGAWPALAAISGCAAIPGPLVALVLIACLNREESDVLVWLYDRTLLAPVMAAAIRALPVSLLVSWWGCRTVPQELIDVARLDGLGWSSQFFHLAWPLRRGLFLAAWLVSFAVASGDLAATLLVTPPGVSTLAIRIFGLLHAGVDDQVAGLCLTNIVLCVFLAWSARILWHRAGR